MGTDETRHSLRNEVTEGYDNITELCELKQVNFDMIRDISKVTVSNSKSNWVDGLVVAYNSLRNMSMGRKYSALRIFIITNFNVPVDVKELDIVLDAMHEDGIQLLGISDCVEHNSQHTDTQFTQDPFQDKIHTQSQRTFMSILDKVDGDLCNINLAEARLLYFEKKKTRSMPWKASLHIGSKLKIEISAYVFVQDYKFISSFKTDSIYPNTVTRTTTEYWQNNQMIEKPDEVDVIKAYQYGDKLVALEDDEDAPKELKGLFFVAFFSNKRIHKDYFTGKGCHVVVAQKEMKKSVTTFYYLVDEMIQMGQLMIAKKVYRNDTKPTLVVFIPEMESDKKATLKMIQLPFHNDLIHLMFPTLMRDRYKPTSEQEKVIKDLVENMNLMEVSIDSKIVEAFDPATTLNPVNQHLCRCVAYRALHPDTPLPTMTEDLAATIDIPESIKEKCKDIFAELETQFPLERVKRKVKKTFGRIDNSDIASSLGDDVDMTTMTDVDDVKSVGTANPAEDFGILLNKGFRFNDIANQMEKVISDFLFASAVLQTQKIIECLMMYREQSKLYSPFNYNNWIREMKSKMLNAGDGIQVDLFETFIVKENLGLITNEENAMSSVTLKDQKDFFMSIEDVRKVAEIVNDIGDDELDDLLE